MENLPDNVLSEIFVRLFAKQLAQMRCVSKPWNALLSHPSFIKSHLTRSLQNNDNILLFFGPLISFQPTRPSFTPRPSSSPHLQLPNFLKLQPILQSQFGGGAVIGSIHGLICYLYLSFPDHKSIQIWNPSLSAFSTLPSPPFQILPSQQKFGFGFDPISDDYKVVMFTTPLDSPDMEPLCIVYTMKKGSWESVSQTFPSHIKIFEDCDQVCVNGCLHWLCATDLEGNGKPIRIVAFDLGKETFIEMQLPESIVDSKWFIRRTVLGVLGGKLCAISRLVVGGGPWEVWVMEEYGVCESWVKLDTFPLYSCNIDAYGFTSKGEFVFQVDQEGDRFGLYDPVEAKSKIFRMTSGYCSISSFVEYVDSLVWIQPPNHEISSCDISRLQIGK